MSVKIISSDNIPSDTSSEHLCIYMIPDHVRSIAEQLCKALNADLNDEQGPYYRVVHETHKLYEQEP